MSREGNEQSPKGGAGDKPKAEPKWVITFAIIAFVVAAVWGVAGFGIWFYYLEPATLGQFGDTFGFVNSLFSALSIAGVIVTLWMQRYELRLQREQNDRSIEEQERSANAQTQSERAQLLSAYLAAVEGRSRLIQARVDWALYRQGNEAYDEHSVSARFAQCESLAAFTYLSATLLAEIKNRFPDLSPTGVVHLILGMCSNVMLIVNTLQNGVHEISNPSISDDDAERLSFRLWDQIQSYREHFSHPNALSEPDFLDSVLKFWTSGRRHFVLRENGDGNSFYAIERVAGNEVAVNWQIDEEAKSARRYCIERINQCFHTLLNQAPGLSDL
jgi:hypothetical protein